MLDLSLPVLTASGRCSYVTSMTIKWLAGMMGGEKKLCRGVAPAELYRGSCNQLLQRGDAGQRHNVVLRAGPAAHTDRADDLAAD